MPVMSQAEFQQKFGRPPSDAGAAVSAQQQTSNQPFANQLTDFMGLKGATDLVGASLAQSPLLGETFTPNNAKQYVQYPTGKEALGAGITGLSYAIPGAGAGAGLATKSALGAATGYGFDVGNKLQQNKGIGESLVPGGGTLAGAAIPIAGAMLSPAAKVVNALLKGTGSAMSGASQRTIEAIGENPQAAAEARNMVESHPGGEQKLVKQNAETIVKGIMNARREARSAFGTALEGLAKEDIKPDVFRGQTQAFLDKYGVSLESGTGVRTFDNVEFSDPKNIQKASDLVDKLANTELDGKSLRKLFDDIEAKKFTTTATDAERLSFNAFAQDMANTIKAAITKSTPKLDAMNAAFSKDMNLIDAVENIFGHVKYGNTEEIQKTARRLESLFNQKGMDPSTTDEFLNRILGIDPTAFKASEAARQMGNVEPPANSPGVNIGETFRAITSAVVSPKLIRDLTIATGAAEEKIKPFLEALSTPARNAVIQLLLHSQPESPGSQQPVPLTGGDMLQPQQ